MSEQSKIERPYQDGSWHFVKYEGLHKEYGAPAMYKANCDAWYSFEFSGIPARQVEVLGPCVNASLPVGVPDVLFDGFAVLSALSDKAKARTSAENVSDVLDAVVKLIREKSAAAPTVKAEQVQCDECGGNGAGGDHEDDCSKAPSLPAAGSAREEVEVVAWRVSHPDTVWKVYERNPEHWAAGYYEIQELMTVAQHERIVAALRAQIAERDAAIEEWSGTAVQNGMEVDRLTAALSAQQSAPEFCCEHSFNAAKQAAWDARRMDRCKCDHNEHCKHCWPDDFKPGGKWHKGFEKQQSAPERVSVPVASEYPKVGWTKRHKHTCANVQPGATAADKCDCGAVEQDKSREAIERAIHLLQASAPSMGCAEWDAAEDLRALLASHGRGEA